MNSSFINHILVKILTLLRFAIPVMFFCNGLIYANTLNKIQVITYNAGLAQFPILPITIVPCNKSRLNGQLNEIEKKLKRPFILILQEVFRNSYSVYKLWAKKHKYSFTKTKVNKSGLMIVTSEDIEHEFFIPFNRDTYMLKRGMLGIKILFNRNELIVLNTHTSYSNSKKVNSIHVSQLKVIGAILNKFRNKTVVLGCDLNVGKDLRYINQTYDPIIKLWHPFISSLHSNFCEIDYENQNVSWDRSNNPLIYKAKFQLFDKFDLPLLHKFDKNEEEDSQLDHIFISSDIEVVYGAKLFLNKPVNISRCKNYTNENDEVYLSDHYALEAMISLQ